MNIKLKLLFAAFAAITVSFGVVSAEGQRNGNVRGGVVQDKSDGDVGSGRADESAAEVRDDAASELRRLRLSNNNKRPSTKPKKDKGGKDDDSDEKEYIVTFKNSKHSGGSFKCDDVARGHKGTVGKKFSKVLNGCTMKLNSKELNSIRKNPNIAIVEEDQKVYASELTDVPSDDAWGLDRINQCNLPFDGKMTKQDATGVKVYILDTGINGIHNDFDGVLEPSTSSCHGDYANENDALFDGNGHGTHVASTTCGLTYGVASNCKLCAVKVLSSGGSGSFSGVISGIQHAVENCAGSKKCVINMSLGGGFSQSINDAVANAVDAGVHVVVAAGNDNANACTKSPASEPKAITVGSLTRTDQRSSFSNWGSCVDIYAPGSAIKAAWIPNKTSTRIISGTSMASPHVAGIAAGIAANGDFTPAQLVAQMKAKAQSAPSDFPDFVDNSLADLATVVNCKGPTPAPTPPPPTPPPTPCVGKSLRVEVLTDNWPLETSWKIKNASTGSEVVSVPQGTYSSQRTNYDWATECVSPGEYTFTMIDSYGDGICCNYGAGSYTIYHGGKEVASGGEFGTSATHTFGSLAPPPTPSPVTPSPTMKPTTGSPTSHPTESPTTSPTTGNPTTSPTESPTSNPTTSPTGNPTSSPTESPTSSPTSSPTESPTSNPTQSPTSNPTESPTHSAAYNEGYRAGFEDGLAAGK